MEAKKLPSPRRSAANNWKDTLSLSVTVKIKATVILPFLLVGRFCIAFTARQWRSRGLRGYGDQEITITINMKRVATDWNDILRQAATVKNKVKVCHILSIMPASVFHWWLARDGHEVLEDMETMISSLPWRGVQPIKTIFWVGRALHKTKLQKPHHFRLFLASVLYLC